VDAEGRKALIRRYRDGHRAVVEALEGVSDEELDRSASDEWTPRMIAHHLADSEMMSAIRLRRLIAEDNPVIHGYDEVEFARALTSDRPVEPSLEAMRWARESTAQILEAVELCRADAVIVLPNNKNIVPVAKQVDALSEKEVAVIAGMALVFALLASLYPAARAARLDPVEGLRRE